MAWKQALTSLTALIVIMAFAIPAEAKTRVTIKNCSQIEYLTYKAYNPWDSKRSLPYQFGKGTVYPVMTRESATVECAGHHWFKDTNECWVNVSKSNLVNATKKLHGGDHIYRGGDYFDSGTRC